MVIAPIFLVILWAHTITPYWNVSFSVHCSRDKRQDWTDLCTYPQYVHSTRNSAALRTAVPLVVYCSANFTTLDNLCVHYCLFSSPTQLTLPYLSRPICQTSCFFTQFLFPSVSCLLSFQQPHKLAQYISPVFSITPYPRNVFCM
jgi:hypothetical protein